MIHATTRPLTEAAFTLEIENPTGGLFSYVWTSNGDTLNSSSRSGLGSWTHYDPPSGIYDIRVFIEDRFRKCDTTLTTTVIRNCDSLNAVSTGTPYLRKISVYPNPTHGDVYVHGLSLNKEAQITLVNTLGKKVKIKQLNNQFDLSELPSGIYILYLTDEGGLHTHRVENTKNALSSFKGIGSNQLSIMSNEATALDNIALKFFSVKNRTSDKQLKPLLAFAIGRECRKKCKLPRSFSCGFECLNPEFASWYTYSERYPPERLMVHPVRSNTDAFLLWCLSLVYRPL